MKRQSPNFGDRNNPFLLTYRHTQGEGMQTGSHLLVSSLLLSSSPLSPPPPAYSNPESTKSPKLTCEHLDSGTKIGSKLTNEVSHEHMLLFMELRSSLQGHTSMDFGSCWGLCLWTPAPGLSVSGQATPESCMFCAQDFVVASPALTTGSA